MTGIEWAWSCLSCEDRGAGPRADREATKHTEATGHTTTTHVHRDDGVGPRRHLDPIAQARREERAQIVAEIRTFEHRGIPLARVIADHIEANERESNPCPR